MPPTKRIARKPSTTPTKRVARPPADQEPDEEDLPEAPDTDDDAPLTEEAANGARRKISGGYGNAQKVYDSTSSYAQAFRPEEASQFIKFLEAAPYANFRRHWIEGRNEQGQRTVRAYTCPLTYDDPCPLCEVGDKPQAVSAFNIALCNDDGTVLLKSWEVGIRLFNVIKGYQNDPKTSPITKNYFMVNKTGKRQNVQYNISPIREGSLREDYDMVPPLSEDLARLKLYTPDIIPVEKKSKLKELAAELATDGDYDDDD